MSGKEISSFPISHASDLAGLVFLAAVFPHPVSAQLRCDLLPRNKPAAGADSSCLDLLAVHNGGLAGTGAYILGAAVTSMGGGQASERTYRVGYLRTPQWDWVGED